MRLVDLAVAAIVDGLSVSGASKRDLTITGDPAACLRLKEAEGARALWTPPIAGARPNDLGKFSGISVYAIPADVVSDRTLLNVVAGAKIVAIQDHTGTIVNERGIEMADLMPTLTQYGGVGDFKGADKVSDESFWDVKCDILIPAALEGQLTPERFERLRQGALSYAQKADRFRRGLKKIGWTQRVPTPEGLSRTYAWLKAQLPR